MKCKRCGAGAEVALRSHHTGFCRDCFQDFFSRQVERAVRGSGLGEPLFERGQRVLVALSGGKDSLALMLELNRQGHDVAGLHLDLGIPGSSEKARAKVESFCALHGLDVRIIELAKEGLAIPDVKRATQRPICSACGKIKRHYFNTAALEAGAVLATGHNLDDETARLLANVLRWDQRHLASQGPALPAAPGFARKVKPLFRLTEFETAAYGFFMGIDPHKAGCPFSRGASFTFHKQLMGQLDWEMPGQKLNFYQQFLKDGRPAFAGLGATGPAADPMSGPTLGLPFGPPSGPKGGATAEDDETIDEEPREGLGACQVCGAPTSAEVCGVCRLREAVRDHAARKRAAARP